MGVLESALDSPANNPLFGYAQHVGLAPLDMIADLSRPAGIAESGTPKADPPARI
jgi:hypothetical protein